MGRSDEHLVRDALCASDPFPRLADAFCERSFAQKGRSVPGRWRQPNQIECVAFSDCAAIRESLVEERPGHLDVAGHSDLRVALQRFSQQRLRLFAISWCCAIHQHHCMEAAYLRMFEEVGEGLGLLHCDLKMLFSGVPLTCRCRGDTRDRLCEAGHRPKRYRSSPDQLTSERIKLRSLRLLAEHDEALNHRREH